ncbi:MAG: hypothetical protein WDZ52_15135 [Pseudohongiellaceae bacterium]
MKSIASAVAFLIIATGCSQDDSVSVSVSDTNTTLSSTSEEVPEKVPETLTMGGERSVMSFFISSRGSGDGGNLGGLAGADAHCQALAEAEYAGDREWRAYLSTMASDGQPAINARDRIGQGPWYNGEGMLIAANLEALHGDNAINKETAVTERINSINGAGDSPNRHDILTGSTIEGRAFSGAEDRTCNNWTSSENGSAQVGHHDRRGRGSSINSWNSEHATQGCSQEDFLATGGDGLFYCFAAD